MQFTRTDGEVNARVSTIGTHDNGNELDYVRDGYLFKIHCQSHDSVNTHNHTRVTYL